MQEAAGDIIGLIRRAKAYDREAFTQIYQLTLTPAAEGSLPDSPLYQVTAAREWAEMAFARTPDTEVAVQVNQVTRRARELERAVKAGRPRVVEALASRTTAGIERTTDRVLQELASGNPRPARRALGAIRRVESELDRLEADAPPSVVPSLLQLRVSLAKQESRLLEARRGEQQPAPQPSKPGPSPRSRATRLPTT